jgi:hypothetical protein
MPAFGRIKRKELIEMRLRIGSRGLLQVENMSSL